MSHAESNARGPDHRMVDRMLFFSDAVFAIVLTLLALELRPPAGFSMSEAELAAGVSEMSLEFVAFGISFALGGGFWLAHMRTTRSLASFDWLTATANLFHLMTVGLVPFAAAILGEHISSAIAFEAYALVMMLAAFSGGLVWLVASRDGGRLLITPISVRFRMASFLRVTGIGWCFAAGLALALAGQLPFARFCWVMIAPILLAGRLLAGPAAKNAAV